MIAPMIHSNGTGGGDLLRQNCDASYAVSNAINALFDAAPNARDYYPLGPDAFLAARKEHEARVARLVAVRDELNGLAEIISDLIDE